MRKLACRSDTAKEGLPKEAEAASSWQLERCSVSTDGHPSCCDGQLQARLVTPLLLHLRLSHASLQIPLEHGT